MVNIEPVDKEFFSSFDEGNCTLCGECFNKCPVMELSVEDSIEEIEGRLLALTFKEYELLKFLASNFSLRSSKSVSAAKDTFNSILQVSDPQGASAITSI